MRHFTKLFPHPAIILGSSWFLSSLNRESVRLESKRHHFEEPNISLTLIERGLPTLSGMGLASKTTMVAGPGHQAS